MNDIAKGLNKIVTKHEVLKVMEDNVKLNALLEKMMEVKYDDKLNNFFLDSIELMSQIDFYHYLHESSFSLPLINLFEMNSLELKREDLHQIPKQNRLSFYRHLKGKLSEFSVDDHKDFFAYFFDTKKVAKETERLRIVASGKEREFISEKDVELVFSRFKLLLLYRIKHFLGLGEHNVFEILENILPLTIIKGLKHNQDLYYLFSQNNIFENISNTEELPFIKKHLFLWYQQNELDFIHNIPINKRSIDIVYPCRYLLNKKQTEHVKAIFESQIRKKYARISRRNTKIWDKDSYKEAKDLKRRVDMLQNWEPEFVFEKKVGNTITVS